MNIQHAFHNFLCDVGKYKTNLRFVHSMHELTLLSYTSCTSPFIHVMTASYTCKVLAIYSVLPSCWIQFELLLWRGLIFSIKLVVWSFLPAWSTLIPDGKTVQIDGHHQRWQLLPRDINDEFEIIKFNHITYYNVLYSRMIPAIPIIT